MKNILIFSLVGWVLLGCSSEETLHCDYGYTNTKEALASCNKAAEQGEALAQIYLGNKYQHGKGEVTRDFAQADICSLDKFEQAPLLAPQLYGNWLKLL